MNEWGGLLCSIVVYVNNAEIDYVAFVVVLIFVHF